MATITFQPSYQPPFALQNTPTGVNHPASLFRRYLGGLFTAGVSKYNGANDLKVAAAGSWGISIARGGGYIQGSNSGQTDQGMYFVYNPSSINMTAPTGPATVRKDIVVARIKDSEAGVTETLPLITDVWVFEYITGDATNFPATPASSLLLAQITIPASSAGITDGMIATDSSVRVPVGMGAVGTNQVITSSIQDLSVTEAKLATAAVTSKKWKPSIQQVMSANGLTLTNAYQTVPGCTITVSPTVASYCLILCHADLTVRDGDPDPVLIAPFVGATLIDPALAVDFNSDAHTHYHRTVVSGSWIYPRIWTTAGQPTAPGPMAANTTTVFNLKALRGAGSTGVALLNGGNVTMTVILYAA